jgi:hypothetical protein
VTETLEIPVSFMYGPMLLAEKCRGRGQLNLVVPGELLCVVDSLSGQKILADTGAAYSYLAVNRQRLRMCQD